LYIGMARYRLKQGDAALIAFQSAGRCDPKLIEAHVALGDTYLERGNNAAALAAYDRALALQSANVSALHGAASVYLRTQDNQKAAALLEKLVSLNAKDAEAHADLGVAYVATGQLDKADIEFHEALHLKPKLPSALLGLGSMYLKNGDEAKAIPLLQETMELAPNAYEPRFLLGSAFNRLGKYEEAMTQLQTAVKLGGEEPEIYYHLARAYGALGRKEERQKALARFAELTKRLKEDTAAQRQVNTLLSEAKVLIDSNDLQTAVAKMELARELQPANYLVLFRLASLYYDFRQYDLARNYAQEALSLAPSEWLYHFLLGMIDKDSGHMQQAQKSLVVAARLNPNAAEVQNALGQVTLSENDTTQAIGYFQRAAQLALCAHASIRK